MKPTSRAFVLTAAALFAATAAYAQDNPPWSQTGLWSIYKTTDRCDVETDLTSGAFVAIEISSDRAIRGIYGGKPLPFFDGPVPISWKLPAQSVTSGDTRVSNQGDGTTMLVTPLNWSFLEAFADTDELIVANNYFPDDGDDDSADDDSNKDIADIKFSGADNAVSELQRCWKALVSEDVGSGKAAATAPLLTNLPSIVTADDYPAEALKKHEFGSTKISLTISAHGVPGTCTLV